MARERVQTLMNLTFEKIHELEDLLYQESKLTGVDVSSQLNTILFRQKEVVDRALKTIDNTRHKVNPSTSLTVAASSPSFNKKPTTYKGANHQGHSISKSESDDNNLRVKLNKTSEKPESKPQIQKSKEQDASWYGSLDRNFAKRKKGRVYLDRSRRSRKTSMSIAGLEQADELQPDEHYEMGLPELSANISKLSLETKEQNSREVRQNRIHFGQSPSSSQISTAAGFRHFNSTPSLLGTIIPNNKVHFPKYSNINESLSGAPATTKSSKSKSWFETNLDESTQSSVLLSKGNLREDDITDGCTANDLSDSSVSVLKLPIPVLSPTTDISGKSSRSSESSESRLNFLNESTKPFEMSDYYKYSTKFRKAGGLTQTDSTEELQGQTKSSSNHLTAGNHQLTTPRIAADRGTMKSLDDNGNPNNSFTSAATKNSTKLTTQLYQSILPNAEVDPLDDDLAWVMDTATFV